jgi:SAM-dependent methyltransferase
MALEALNIPNHALIYILYQRTKYQVLKQSLPIRLLQRSGIPIPYKTLVGIESRFRKQAIKELFSQDMYREYELLRGALPERPLRILDIGCGVACIDVFLFRHYLKSKNLSFWLLDRSEVSTRLFYYFQDRTAFYNSLEIARELLRANGVVDEQINTLSADDNFGIPIAGPVDLVISLISWGYHYPVKTYLESVVSVMHDESTLILDIRPGTDGVKTLKSAFRIVRKVPSPPWCERYACRK